MNGIQKIIGLQNGNGKCRLYSNAKKIRNLSLFGSALEFSLASGHAAQHKGFWTGFFGGFCIYFTKNAIDCHKIVKILRPARNEIVARAKSIYSKHKLSSK